MASLCMNSLPLPPSSHSKKLALTEASSSSNGSIAAAATASKPIVVSGNTPTFVSAPGRRIVAGLFLFFWVSGWILFQFSDF